MYKSNVELFTVKPNFKVKFSLILKEDNEATKFKKLIQKFKIDGNTYLSVVPYPFVVFDISNKKDINTNGYSKNDTITFTRKHLFFLISKLEKLISDFTTKDLFFYDVNGDLQVNSNLASNLRVVHQTTNKTILVQHCVVRDEETNKDYEGCFLSINTLDHYTEITYSELRFLVHELKKIDFTSYSLQMIQIASLFRKEEVNNIEIKKESIVEEKEEEISDKKTHIKFVQPHEIPEI